MNSPRLLPCCPSDVGKGGVWSPQYLGLEAGMPSLVPAILVVNASLFLCTSLFPVCLPPAHAFERQSCLVLCFYSVEHNTFWSVIVAPQCYGNTVNKL